MKKTTAARRIGCAKKCGLWLLIIGLLFLSACRVPAEEKATDRLQIVTTIFPPYDFARTVAGDAADVSMLLRPGMESHSYEPSPADIIRIENCDLFIYNGGESDTWVDALLDTIDTSNCRVLRMMECVPVLEEETVEGIQTAGGHEDEEEGHGAEYDEHVWTSPKNAIRITEKIADFMIELDPKHQDGYKERRDRYIEELRALDQMFSDITAHAKHKLMVFGDRFPFLYFTKEYGLDYRAAFPGCSAESEPSAKTVAYLIDKIRKEQIPCIFYIEFSNQKLAKTLQEETGVAALQFHSCHNVSKDEAAAGCTYLSLMQKNAENLKEALGNDADSLQ